MPLLKITYNNSSFEISKETRMYTIGRLQENDLLLDFDFVSGYHGRIYRDNTSFFYEDLDSTNGTYIRSAGKNEDYIQNQKIVLSERGTICFGNSAGPEIAFSCIRDNQDILNKNLNEISRGIFLLESGCIRQALELFENKIDKDPESIDAYYYAGFAASRLEKYDNAILRFEQYLLMRSEDAEVMTDLGRVYERTGQIQKARNWYLKAVHTGNDDGDAQKRLKELSRFPENPRVDTWKVVKSAEPNSNMTNHFKVTFILEDHFDVVKPVLKNLELSFQVVGDFLGYYPVSKKGLPVKRVRVELVSTDKKQSGKTDKYGIVLHLNQNTRGEIKFLEVLIRHEYSHYVLGRLTQFSHNIPWWFHEGFAQCMSQNITPDRLSYIKQLAQAGKLLPLNTLKKGMGRIKDRQFIRVAYLEAHAAVTFSLKHYGRSKVISIIRHLAAHGDTKKGFAAAGQDYQSFETLFFNWLIEGAQKGQIKLTQRIG